ncbi:YafY family protein [Sphingomonas bacterium]|uniref:helix-turn-helix transcriptional regulator n=1 Tax=Sphingomonas bacterium TaxID=1895847 RepID=UPI001574FF0A|nr:YafY family protein [Sphingomonas bacterium]
MTRAERLFAVLQCLRRHRFPVSAASLAAELSVSVRSIYRDIASLRTQGATIEGEAGIGFVLKPGFLLPPLMFSEDEVEAIVFGARWVAMRGDRRLAHSGKSALAKIVAVLPPELREEADLSFLLVGPDDAITSDEPHLPLIRDAIRRERPLTITYVDAAAGSTERNVWPIALAYFDRARIIIAWCELRQTFRHFRTDRATILAVGQKRYPRRRAQLVAEWRRLEGVPSP